MNKDFELKLKVQAWVDGELSGREGREVAALVASDKSADELAAELRTTRSFLSGNEPEATLPEGHDFYWGKIQRQIEQSGSQDVAAPSVSWAFAWRRMLAPLSGVALVALVTLVSLNFFQHPNGDDALANLVEVENPSEHIGSISYRSQAENMFVVWLYDKETENETKSAEVPEPMDDVILQ